MAVEWLLLVTVAILSMFCVMGSHAQVDENTFLYYDFDEVKGQTVTDRAKNLNAELFGDAKIDMKVGVVDGGLVLDGIDDYVQARNVQFPQDEATMEMWVKLDSAVSPVGGSYYSLLAVGGGFESEFDHLILAPDKIGIYTDQTGWNWANSNVPITELVGEWCHIVGTYGERGMEIWVDGELVGKNEFYTDGLSNPSYPAMVIGSSGWRGDAQGTFDAVRISNVQREADDFLLDVPVRDVAPEGNLAVTWGCIKMEQGYLSR